MSSSLRASNGCWFIWSISSIWFVWLIGLEIHPEEPDRPERLANQTDEPKRVARAHSILFHPSWLVPFSNGVAPALILLRPSSEALLRARAPGAGDQCGCDSTLTPSPSSSW
jgi:hypothetical protein